MTYDEFRLKQWQIEPPTDDLEERIYRNAVSLPQHVPLAIRMERAIQAFFTEWCYALAYKAVAFACFAALGFYVGTQQPAASLTPTNIAKASPAGLTDMAMARNNWMDPL